MVFKDCLPLCAQHDLICKNGRWKIIKKQFFNWFCSPLYRQRDADNRDVWCLSCPVGTQSGWRKLGHPIFLQFFYIGNDCCSEVIIGLIMVNKLGLQAGATELLLWLRSTTLRVSFEWCRDYSQSVLTGTAASLSEERTPTRRRCDVLSMWLETWEAVCRTPCALITVGDGQVIGWHVML